jgi:hypothetical protein
MRKKRIVNLIIGAVIGMSGFALVWIYSGWELALAIVLINWGNNIEQSNRLDK